MKRTLLATALVFHAVSNPSFAQTKPGAKSPSTTVPAASKKSVAKLARPVEHVVHQPFVLESLETGRISPGYIGLPVQVVVEAIEAVKNIKKGEFESTSEFEARRNDAMSKKLIGNVGFDDLLPFVLEVKKYSDYSNGLAYSYDADAGEASLYILPAAERFNGIGGPDYKSGSYNDLKLDTLKIEAVAGPRRTYEASNAYGAKVQVEESTLTWYGFATESISFVTGKRDTYYKAAVPALKLNMDPASAAKELPLLKAMLIAKLRPPYVKYNYFHSKPTRDDPREMTLQTKSIFGDAVQIVFYSGNTGEIYAQFPQPAVSQTGAIAAP